MPRALFSLRRLSRLEGGVDGLVFPAEVEIITESHSFQEESQRVFITIEE